MAFAGLLYTVLLAGILLGIRKFYYLLLLIILYISLHAAVFNTTPL